MIVTILPSQIFQEGIFQEDVLVINNNFDVRQSMRPCKALGRQDRLWTGILFCVNISNALDYSDYCKIFLQWENIFCWRMTRFRIFRHLRDLRTITERPPLRTKVRRRWSSYPLDIYYVTCVRVGRMKRVEVRIQSTRKTNFRTMG